MANIERLQFADTKQALDAGPTGHAGQAMEFIGTNVPSDLGNLLFRGQVITLLDQGNTMLSLPQRALDLGLVPKGNDLDVNTVYRNVPGGAPDQAMTSTLLGYVEAHR